MLEMKLNTTAAIDSVGLDPVNIVSYQKTRQLRDRLLTPVPFLMTAKESQEWPCIREIVQNSKSDPQSDSARCSVPA
jgi:hypothetical protein